MLRFGLVGVEVRCDARTVERLHCECDEADCLHITGGVNVVLELLDTLSEQRTRQNRVEWSVIEHRIKSAAIKTNEEKIRMLASRANVNAERGGIHQL